MPEGVIILHEEMATITPWWCILMAIVGGLAAFMAMITNDEIETKTALFMGVTGAILCTIGIICILTVNLPTGKMKYVVDVPSDVSFVELYNNYDILKKEDYVNIYTIREK